MNRFARRLRDLEARLTDRNGFVPGTKPWWDYWKPMLDKVIAGETLDQKIPLDVFDVMFRDDVSSRHFSRVTDCDAND